MSPKTPIRIMLGTQPIGDPTTMPGVIHFDTEKDVSKLLSAFHDRGYTELDTAANYAGSEYRLGLVAAPSKFTIHTKIKSGLPGDLTADKIALSVEKSLQDFKTTSVQTFLLHAPDRETDPEETVKAMHEVVKQGKCKEWGLSNYKSEEVKEILRICNGKGYIKPTVYEGHYNALVRGGEDELFPLLREHKMAFWAYSPAAGGFFKVKEETDTSQRWTGNSFIAQMYSSFYGSDAVKASVETVQNAAGKHGIDGHSAALRWTAYHSALDGNFGDAVIFAVSRLEQLDKTIDALQAGPLPDELAVAMGEVYGTLDGTGPSYHL